MQNIEIESLHKVVYHVKLVIYNVGFLQRKAFSNYKKEIIPESKRYLSMLDNVSGNWECVCLEFLFSNCIFSYGLECSYNRCSSPTQSIRRK